MKIKGPLELPQRKTVTVGRTNFQFDAYFFHRPDEFDWKGLQPRFDDPSIPAMYFPETVAYTRDGTTIADINTALGDASPFLVTNTRDLQRPIKVPRSVILRGDFSGFNSDTLPHRAKITEISDYLIERRVDAYWNPFYDQWFSYFNGVMWPDIPLIGYEDVDSPLTGSPSSPTQFRSPILYPEDYTGGEIIEIIACECLNNGGPYYSSDGWSLPRELINSRVYNQTGPGALPFPPNPTTWLASLDPPTNIILDESLDYRHTEAQTNQVTHSFFQQNATGTVPTSWHAIIEYDRYRQDQFREWYINTPLITREAAILDQWHPRCARYRQVWILYRQSVTGFDHTELAIQATDEAKAATGADIIVVDKGTNPATSAILDEMVSQIQSFFL